MKLIILLVAIVVAGVTQPVMAQDVAVKTNLLSEGTEKVLTFQIVLSTG